MRVHLLGISSCVCCLTVAVSLWNFLPTAATAEPQLPEGLVLTTPDVPIELVGSMKSLNEKLSEGLKPSDNAVIFLLATYGPETFERDLKRDSDEAVGLKALPPSSPLFLSLDDFSKTLEGVPAAQSFEVALEIQGELFNAGETEWTPETYPRLAKFLAANEAALKMVTLAASKPRYYAPVLSIETPPRLMSAALNVERRLPYLARMLAARALLEFGNHNFEACLNDLASCHQLANLLATGSPLDVSVAKAHVIDSIACRAEEVLLASGKLTASEIQALAAFNQNLPKLPPAARAIDIGERAIVHQEIELLSTDKDSIEGFFEAPGGKTPPPSELPDLDSLPWQQSLARADEIWDQIVQALTTTDRKLQNERFTKLDVAYAKWEADDDADSQKFAELLKKDPAAAARKVGENMAMSLRPLWWQRRATDERSKVRHDLVTLGIALKAYQLEHGEFPESLAALTPKHLPSIPADAHSDSNYIYHRLAKDHARLTSLGINLTDDAGMTYSDDQILQIR